jgi:type I restriction enzyme S subunit
MSAVKGWERKTFNELGVCIRGVSYKPVDLRPAQAKENVTLLRSNNIKNGRLNYDNLQFVNKSVVREHQNLQNEDIAICMSNGNRALVGKSGKFVARGDNAVYTVGAFCSIFRPADGFDAGYIRHLFGSDKYQKQLDGILAGSAINNLKGSDIDGLVAFCPTSKPEQNKIAEILSTVDHAIEQTEALIAKQQRIKTGLMQDLLTRGIDEHGNLRSEQTHEFKDSPLGRIPVEWEVTDWGSVGYWKGGSTPSKGDPKNWFNGINLWVSPKDIKAPILETTEDLLTDRALTVSKLHVFRAGSIFTVFRSGILKHTIPISTCSKAFSVNQDIKVLIPKSETNIKFLKYLLSYCSPDILRTAVKAGTTVESIDRLVFEGMKIPRPDLPEQTRISDVLDQQESMSITLKNELLKLRSLKTALMQDLLTGKKRVTSLLNDTEVSV